MPRKSNSSSLEKEIKQYVVIVEKRYIVEVRDHHAQRQPADKHHTKRHIGHAELQHCTFSQQLTQLQIM